MHAVRCRCNCGSKSKEVRHRLEHQLVPMQSRKLAEILERSQDPSAPLEKVILEVERWLLQEYSPVPAHRSLAIFFIDFVTKHLVFCKGRPKLPANVIFDVRP